MPRDVRSFRNCGADRQGDTVPEAKITRLNEKIETLRQEIQRLNFK